ncbi:MAG: F0F1 ATP synthase subunit B [Bacteroidia bacterium]|nr:F0F1 ATP synthase subunit B [Bacteroidia bacterium]
MIITPQFGLFFWATVIFLTFFFILRRFAWKPILEAITSREASIEKSLQEAVQAREEMSRLKADNESLLKEARQERDKILKEAHTLREQIVREARDAAAEAAKKEQEKAKQQIETEKNVALNEIKLTAAQIAVEVAEKILRKELDNKGAQEEMARRLISDLNNN